MILIRLKENSTSLSSVLVILPIILYFKFKFKSSFTLMLSLLTYVSLSLSYPRIILSRFLFHFLILLLFIMIFSLNFFWLFWLHELPYFYSYMIWLIGEWLGDETLPLSSWLRLVIKNEESLVRMLWCLGGG